MRVPKFLHFTAFPTCYLKTQTFASKRWNTALNIPSERGQKIFENFLFCACENEKLYCIYKNEKQNCIIHAETENSLKPTPTTSSRGKIPPPSLWRAKHASSICCSCHISCQLSHETVCSHQDVEVRKPFHRGVFRLCRRCSTVRNHPQQTTTVCRGRDALRSVPGSAGVKPCAV